MSIKTAFPRKAATKNSAESLDAVFLCLSSPFSSLTKEKNPSMLGSQICAPCIVLSEPEFTDLLLFPPY